MIDDIVDAIIDAARAPESAHTRAVQAEQRPLGATFHSETETLEDTAARIERNKQARGAAVARRKEK